MSKILEYTILTSLLLTPILNINELIATYNLNVNLTSIETPLYIKLLKDLCFIFLFLESLIIIFLKGRIKYRFLILALVFLIIISSLTSLLYQDIRIIISGLRWSFPIFLIFSFLNFKFSEEFNLNFFKTNNFQHRILKILIFLFYINFFLQIFQFFYFPGFYGKNFLDLNLRNTGFFSLPITASFFVIVVSWYIYVFYNSSIHKRILLYLLSPISIFLTASGTGMMALIVFYLYVFITRIKQRLVAVMISCFIVVIAFFFIDKITGREDIYDSIITRIMIFNEHILKNMNNIFLSTNFGIGTNTAVLFGNLINLPMGIIADSQYTSVAINLGFLGFLFFLILFLSVFMNSYHARLFIIIYGIFSLTTIFFEAYPMNLLFALNTAYFLSYKDNKDMP